MCRNHFLNFYTLTLICYNTLKMAAIEVKLMTSLSQTRILVVVSGTDFPANFCVRIHMYEYVLHSLFVALPYPETGHACGSVKPLDPAE